MSIKMFSSGKEIENVVLKSCPFCGGTNLWITDEKSFNKLCDENGSALIGLTCRTCDTEVKVYTIPNNNYWMGVGMLICKWNTRNNGGAIDAD